VAAALGASRDLVADGHPTLVVVSADNDLPVAARAEGLATEKPFDYS
jgi:hypothetical protein